MTAKELRRVLAPLKDEQHICFNLERQNDDKERIDRTNLLILYGYERIEIGEDEDELFVIKLKLD